MKTALTPKQEARRDRVLEAAVAAAVRGGYDAVQMRDVAAEAEVALGTLYRYFASKDQLLVAVMGQWTRQLQGQLARRPPQGDTAADRVIEGIRKERMMMESLRGDADLIVDTSGLSPHELRDRPSQRRNCLRLRDSDARSASLLVPQLGHALLLRPRGEAGLGDR